MSLANIVLTQTQMGPHAVTFPEVGMLVIFLMVAIMLFPYLQDLPLIYRRGIK